MNVAATLKCQRLGLVARRGFATVRKYRNPAVVPDHVRNTFLIPDEYLAKDEPEPEDPAVYKRNPVTSAHAIDLDQGKPSTLDSASLTSSGSVVHGRYGDLGAAAQAIPLEYLALLRPAAEGAAAVRVTQEKSKSSGTLLIYGASQANGLAALQLATAAGHTVVGVIGGEHSGNENMHELIKYLTKEPGTAVKEEYALAKKNFQDLVKSISTGDEALPKHTADEYLEEFKANLLAYTERYPEKMPAAVDKSKFQFLGMMDRSKKYFKENMEAYLSQFMPGAPPLNEAQFDALFTSEQYEIFRARFWEQTSDIISGDEKHFFSPPHIVKELLEAPGKHGTNLFHKKSKDFPYSFSVLDPFYPAGAEAKAGGPVVGAIIAVTPTLESAAKAIHEAKGLRAKGEALQFMTSAQRGAFGAACSVAKIAKDAGAPVLAIGGSLPELESVEPTDADVQEALAAMDIADDGTSKLNYFIQVYRAGDFPFYSDYAVHRASEPHAGPRQIIVTK